MSRRRSPRTEDDNQTRVMDQPPPSIDLLCPDDEAEIERQWREAMDEGHPVSRRYLRNKLRREFGRAADHWEGGAVLTYLTRHGSVPVDRAVGELVAGRL